MYKPYFKDHFAGSLRKLTKRNTILKKRVESKIKDMLNDPYHNSKELVGQFKGKRTIYVGKAGYRIVYVICEECRIKSYQRFNQCIDCNKKEKEAIIFWDIQPRNVAYI